MSSRAHSISVSQGVAFKNVHGSPALGGVVVYFLTAVVDFVSSGHFLVQNLTRRKLLLVAFFY